MTDDTQMFIDRGEGSFLTEVIGTVRWTRLHIDMVENADGRPLVRVEFKAIIPNREGPDAAFTATEFAPSYGLALRKIREALRWEIGA